MKNRATIPISTAPTCPPDAPPEVQAEFRRLVELMDGRAAHADEIALTMLATSLTTWRRATAEVAKVGPVVMSGGVAIQNPSLGIAHQAHGQILALCRELGLTAASRAKVKPSTKPSGLPSLGAK